jgi:hypothetical protein
MISETGVPIAILKEAAVSIGIAPRTVSELRHRSNLQG